MIDALWERAPAWVKGGLVVVVALGLLALNVTSGRWEVPSGAARWVGLGIAAAGIAGGGGWALWQKRLRDRQAAVNAQLASEGVVRLVMPPVSGGDWRKVRSAAIEFFLQLTSVIPPDEHISLEIVAVEEGIHLMVWGREDTVNAVSLALRGTFPKVIVRDDFEDPIGSIAEGGKKVAWVKGVLSQSSAYPITMPNERDSDPLQAVLAVLYQEPGMDPIGVQIVLRPSTKGTEEAAREYRRLMNPAQQRPVDKNTVKAVGEKADALAGFQVTVRAFAAGSSITRLNTLTQALTSATRGRYNGLVFQGKSEAPQPLVGRYFDLADEKTVLSAGEMVALWHPPGRDVQASGLRRAKGVLPPPPIAAVVDDFTQGCRVIGLGYLPSGKRSPVAWRYGFDTLVHGFVVGPTGAGKSTLMRNLSTQDILQDKAYLLLEPHASLTHDVIRAIPRWKETSVIWLNPTHPVRAFGVNPMSCADRSEIQATTSGVLGIIAKMFPNWDQAVRMQTILRNAVLALLEGEERPTLFHLYLFVNYEGYREQVLEKVKDPSVLTYFRKQFGAMTSGEQAGAVASVINRLSPFVSSPLVRHIVAQPETTVDFRWLMDTGKIVLLDVSEKDPLVGKDVANVLGAALMQAVWAAVVSRRDVVSRGEAAREAYFYVDEFQNYAGDTGLFNEMLTEARKFFFGLVLATQYSAQLPQAIKDAVAANCRTKIVYAFESADDARWVGKMLGVDPEDVLNMEEFHALVRMSVNRHASSTFAVATFPPLPPQQLWEKLGNGRSSGDWQPVEDVQISKEEQKTWKRHLDGMGVSPKVFMLGTGDRSRDFAMVEHCAEYLKGLGSEGLDEFSAVRRKMDRLMVRRLVEAGRHAIPDKEERIMALSALQWMVPRAEVEAQVRLLQERVEGADTDLEDVFDF